MKRLTAVTTASVLAALFSSLLSAAEIEPQSPPVANEVALVQAETIDDAARETSIAVINQLGGRITLDPNSNVTRLDLDGKNITDAEMKHLKSFPKLEFLNLSRTPITDAGLESLKSLKALTDLYLYETSVSDTGLDNLIGLTKLRFLMLKRSEITEAGAAKLQQKLPDCLISHSPRTPAVVVEGLPVGRWTVEFSNGVKQTCEIHKDGRASVVEIRRTSAGKAALQDRATVVAYDDDRVERWTQVGNRMVVEHWPPVATSPSVMRDNHHVLRILLPTATPVLGIADRAP